MNITYKMNKIKTYASVVKNEKKETQKPVCQCCRKKVKKTVWYECFNLHICEECINFIEYNGFV